MLSFKRSGITFLHLDFGRCPNFVVAGKCGSPRVNKGVILNVHITPLLTLGLPQKLKTQRN